MASTHDLLIAFIVTDIVACLMPGPAVMMVTSIGLTGSLRGMAGAIAGINISNLIWYAMVSAGLIALMHAAPVLFAVLRWAGILYLFWLGIQTWRNPAHLSATRGFGHIGFTRGMMSAVAVQLSNPKALIFFTVFLPPFIDMHRPVAQQIVTLAAIGVSLEIIALAMYGTLAYRLGRVSMSPRAELWVARGSGAIFMAIAAAMALSQA